MSDDKFHVSVFLSRSEFTLDVDIQLPPNGVTAVYGPSGCGKTTLLRAVAGLEKAAQGNIVINGKHWQDSNSFIPTYKRALGFVFQDAYLLPHLNVEQHLAFAVSSQKLNVEYTNTNTNTNTFASIVEVCGLLKLMQKQTSELSGGQKQRAAIACALLREPELLLLDEPLASLDAQASHGLLGFLEKLKTEISIPILYVSHSMNEVSRLADYVVMMQDGKIIDQGDFQSTLGNAKNVLVFEEGEGVVIDGVMTSRDADFQLAVIESKHCEFHVPDFGYEVGSKVRLQVLAKDVSLSLVENKESSILNVIAGEVIDIHQNLASAGVVLVKINCCGQMIYARVTKKSLVSLKIEEGKKVWAQVKSVAILSH